MTFAYMVNEFTGAYWIMRFEKDLTVGSNNTGICLETNSLDHVRGQQCTFFLGPFSVIRHIEYNTLQELIAEHFVDVL